MLSQAIPRRSATTSMKASRVKGEGSFMAHETLLTSTPFRQWSMWSTLLTTTPQVPSSSLSTVSPS